MTDLTEMWAELEAHQSLADARGYGKEWREMCAERTEKAAAKAADAAWEADWDAANAAWDASDAALFVDNDAMYSARSASEGAIEQIQIAKKEKPNDRRR